MALSALLGGCSALRLSFDNGPLLAWWWLDGYVDFSREQAAPAKAALAATFDWARATQLSGYADLAAAARADVAAPATADQACRWQQRVRDRLEPLLEQALQRGADLVPGLGEPQWQHLAVQFAKKNDELRRELLLPPTPEERLAAAVKRVSDRAEMLYGPLDAPQQAVIRAGVEASPFDARAWIAERERWQRDSLQTLRRLVAERADHDRIVAALRVLVERAENSPDPDYRRYQQRLTIYNCAFAARVHNATSPAQRQIAAERLKGWEDDLRVLAARR